MINQKKQFIFNAIENSYQNESVNSPLGKNSISSLAILFEDREYYSDFIIPTVNERVDNIKIFADLIKENSLYGLLNNDLDGIYLNKQYTKEIPSANEETKFALNFVADAFNEMNKYLLNAASVGKLSKQSVFYKLKAHRAFLDFNVFMDTSDVLSFNDFVSSVANNRLLSSQIRNIDDFNNKFILHLKKYINSGRAVTKSSLLFDSYFLGYTSGLIIDIAKDAADNDTIKYEKYFLDSGFSVFADACRRFGFLIDKNMPWKLIADLNSPAMLGREGDHIGYMSRNNINSLEELYSKYFIKCYTDDIEYLTRMFHEAYSFLLTQSPNYELDYKKLQICDFNNQTTFEREKISFDEFKKRFPDTYWVRLLVYLRNYEENRGFTQQQFENVAREANNFVKAGRIENALKFVNDYFKQFNYVEYFSSLQQQNKELQQIADRSPMPQILF